MEIIERFDTDTVTILLARPVTIMGGPYAVYIRRNGHYSSSTTGIRTIERALDVYNQEVARFT